MIAFYPSKTNNLLNGLPFEPELIDARVMVNPHYPVAVASGPRVVCDSGAFQERDMLRRLTPAQALDRQLAFERSVARNGQRRFPGGFEAVVSYDQLVGVDEALEGGKRVKRRGNEETAAEAVAQTIASAELYHRERYRVAGAVAYAAQGATLRQYLACVRTLLELAGPRDWLALGGFCIIGMQPSLKPLFAAVCREVAPLMRRKGLRRAHILGVCVTDALTDARAAFEAEGVEVSTDSSSIEMNSTMGRSWSEDHMRGGTSPWRQVYGPADKGVLYQVAELSIANIRRFASWCAASAATGTMRARCICSDGDDGIDWVNVAVPAGASIDRILDAAEDAGVPRLDVEQVQVRDGCYTLVAGEPVAFDSWSILDRGCRSFWRSTRITIVVVCIFDDDSAVYCDVQLWATLDEMVSCAEAEREDLIEVQTPFGFFHRQRGFGFMTWEQVEQEHEPVGPCSPRIASTKREAA